MGRYRCRRARISVHYCAEMFPNDGSVMAALLKAVKRAMAAEYSRELSAKVFAGQARLTELGFGHMEIQRRFLKPSLPAPLSRGRLGKSPPIRPCVQRGLPLSNVGSRLIGDAPELRHHPQHGGGATNWNRLSSANFRLSCRR
jgi:hypothetical protein